VVMLAAALFLLMRRSGEHHPEISLTNPLELGMALKMAVAIAAIMLCAKLAQDWLGSAGVLALAGVSGLLDVDAVTVSMSRMAGAQMPLEVAKQAVAVVVGVNTLTKSVMAGVIGGSRIGLLVGSMSVLSLAAGWAVMVLV